MGADKVVSLSKYLEDMQTRLAEAVPVKHQGRVKEYHNFLKQEIKRTSAKIEEIRLSAPAKK